MQLPAFTYYKEISVNITKKEKIKYTKSITIDLPEIF